MKRIGTAAVAAFLWACSSTSGAPAHEQSVGQAMTTGGVCPGRLTESDSQTRDGFGNTAAEAQNQCFYWGYFFASSKCETKLKNKCPAGCVMRNSGSKSKYTTNSAEHEATNAAGTAVTEHYTDAANLAGAPGSWTPTSVTNGNTGRARSWKVNATVKVDCWLDCVADDAGSDAQADAKVDAGEPTGTGTMESDEEAAR